MIIVAVLAATLLEPPPAYAAPPPDFQTSLVIGADLNEPSGFEIAPDGRIFILERSGKIRIYKNGHLLATPFADLPSEASGDRGLIGIAFDPEFGVANHYVYFYYTGLDLHNRLVRFDASGDVGTDGPYTIFRTESLSQQLHVGGSIRFGPDGKMYFAVGDNGYSSNAQVLSNPHGKILRINKDGSIPADNPFYGQAGKEQAIWAYGFRNPWRFQFDSLTGQLYGGDVGDYTWEEVNHIVKGGNYGWPLKEGICAANCAGFTDPIYVYPHNGESAAATGGPIYRGDQFPAEYQGNLFFADYAKGFIRRAVLDAAGNATSVTDFDATAGSVVDMKVGPDGSLYYLTFIPGRLYKVSYSLGNHAPTAVASSDVTGGDEPLTVHFSGEGSTDPDGDDLTFEWDFGDDTTSVSKNPTKTYSQTGVYQVTLTVRDSEGNANSAVPIIIQVGIPPTVRIAVPADGSTYRAGDVITYNSFATDAAGFDLDDNDITTNVVLHHGTHIHPFVGPLTGRAGQFTIPVTGESSADTWYRITTTATDANGLSATKSINIRPLTSTFTLTTNPPGLPLYLDGIPETTPHERLGVVGFQREVYAPPTATAEDGTVLHFTGWSDGKGIRHSIVTPAQEATFTANYAPSPAFTATFYGNRNLAGTPLLTRSDPAVDFIWGAGKPDPAVPADEFSARWTKKQYFAGGRYRFTTVSDDGVRLYIDRELVLDQWNGQSGTAYDWVGDLGAGTHTITMEYFEAGGEALAKLDWVAAIDQPSDTWKAEYWDITGANDSPTLPVTAPALTQNEPAVDHDWGTGSPIAATDHFAARWTRTVSLAPGEYEFTTTADDGVRLTVDGLRLIDDWADGAARVNTETTLLSGGPHTIVMEYYENFGDAVAKLAFRQTADATDPPDWAAEFWNTADPAIPARAPDLTRTDSVISNDWGGGSPDPAVDENHFVARWTRTDTLPAGVYRFSGRSDDGIRVYLDGVPIVDKWVNQNDTFSTDRLVLSGTHQIRVEYYEYDGGAIAQFGYQRIGDVAPDDTWDAEFFAGTALAGTPVATRQDENINFDWGAGSPDPALPGDGWSARWTRTAEYAAGTYRFSATGDDGIRVLLDGVTVVDGWSDHAPTTFTADIEVAAGEHTVIVEFYERGGGALARFNQNVL
ncbi:glucose/arabinose dehydrogenase [Actinoplanes lutulentus]|uniref:Glucose/arabinose dehydrogenase n=1 Tax=Actinoplanes lutulentus TaxID=1287878 RepID=A0A327ZC56_9ACTN|nr:PA14 domain-containing protein [Actinoplanes lutulentus]MBB2941358.1 glucose/arabinose dehydrogenase [Actinoplanes lutulentus]RAK36850.1 glucose/arabinose dehydrogenase [Actinoplanes lutulentus]